MEYYYLCYSLEKEYKLNFVTYCPHILVTKEVNIEDLIIYIEAQIESGVLNLESPSIYSIEPDAEENTIIQFKYREIKDKKEITEKVSKIEHKKNIRKDKIDFKKEEEFMKINFNKNIIKYLNIIPFNKNYFGEIIDNNYISYNGEKGILYKYKENIRIFIYSCQENSYKGIVYKHNIEYISFIDTIIKNNKEYDLIRTIKNQDFYIKNNKIVFMETKINSNLINKKEKAITYNYNFITFDIECYLEKNSKELNFVPYACQRYAKDDNKFYIVNDFKN